jgi:hypothetical protein
VRQAAKLRGTATAISISSISGRRRDWGILMVMERIMVDQLMAD